MLKFCRLLLLIFTFVPTFIWGQEKLQFLQIGLEFDLPPNWTYVQETDAIDLTSPNGSVMISFQVFAESDLEEVMAALDTMMANLITDLKMVGEPSLLELNGLDVLMAEAKGKMDGISVQLGTFIIPREEHVLLIMGIAKSKAKKEDIEGLDIAIGTLRVIE